MKYFYALLQVIICCTFVQQGYTQQNLVLNPSFEDIDYNRLLCGSYQGGNDFDNVAYHWTIPSLGTSDIFHMSLNPSCTSHPLFPGNDQLPRTGDSMAHIIVLTGGVTGNSREYLQGELSQPLTAGKKYTIAFFTALKANPPVGLGVPGNLGVKFFTAPYFQPTSFRINQADANFPLTITNIDDWFLVEMEFTPQVSGLQYFIIGNFTLGIGDINTMHTYLIDDVSIIVDPFEQMGPYCQGESFTLPKVSEEGYTGTWSPAVNNQQTTTYTFTPDDPSIPSYTMTVEIIPLMEPEFTIEKSVCYGTNLTLPTVSNNGYSGVWSPKFNPHQTTTYTFKPDISDAKPCIKPIRHTVEIKMYIDFKLEYYCKQGIAYIEAIVSQPSSQNIFEWKINEIPVNETSHLLNLSTHNNLLKDYNIIELTVTSEDGCSSTKFIEREDKGSWCTIQKGISPNGDGLNDYFDLESFGGVYLRIFNRYGIKIYENSLYTNQWWGQSTNGTLLPTGTYFYNIQTVRGETFTGWIQLINEIKN